MDIKNKVNLIIVGAPKCGTTAWVEYLNTHPDIYFCRYKEPHYFSTDFPHFRWAQSLDDYQNLFDDVPVNTKIIAEASIMYLYSSVAAENIFTYNPAAKILIFLRSYVSFLKSYHRQLLNLLDEDEIDFSRAWTKQESRRNGDDIPKECREPSFLQYRDVASFGCQLDRYFNMYPKEQIKVISFEQWTKAPRKTYLEILDFLELPDDGREQFAKINVAKLQRSRTLAKLTRRPPQFLLNIVTILKKIAGVERLNWASWLKTVNERASLVEDIPDQLKRKILEELRGDAKLVKKLVDYDPSAAS